MWRRRRQDGSNAVAGNSAGPAYPAGHSTYAGAASEILTYFFPSDEKELYGLADNTGMARLWASIHYRSDHEQGSKLGRCVAWLMISQLESDGVPLPSALAPMTTVPSKAEVRIEAYENRREYLKDPSPKGQRHCKPPQQDPGCEDD